MPTRPLAVMALIALLLTACGGADAVGSGPAPSAPGADPAAQGIAEGEPAPGTSPDGSTPIPVEPDGGIGDGAGPVPVEEVPDYGVSSETDSVAVSPYTSCWSAPSGSGICEDGEPAAEPVLAADGQLVVTFEPGELTASSSAPIAAGEIPTDRAPLPVVQENPGIWLVDVSGLPAGPQTVWLDWQGAQGDAFAALTVEVS